MTGTDANPLNAQIWRNRLATLRAISLLVLAACLVRFVPMSRWRSSLGEIHQGGVGCLPVLREGDLRRAAAVSRQVVRAVRRLPWEPKCLAQAMALQWLLRREEIGSQLVLAMDRRDRTADHGYHAWVECGGIMLIGACERDNYHVVLGFVTPLQSELEGACASSPHVV